VEDVIRTDNEKDKNSTKRKGGVDLIGMGRNTV